MNGLSVRTLMYSIFKIGTRTQTHTHLHVYHTILLVNIPEENSSMRKYRVGKIRYPEAGEFFCRGHVIGDIGISLGGNRIL